MTFAEKVELKPQLRIGEIVFVDGKEATIADIIPEDNGTRCLVKIKEKIYKIGPVTTSVWENQICPNTSSLKSS